MKTRDVLLLITISAALTCVSCTSSPNAPSATNSSSQPAVESPPATSPLAVSKLPSGADPVNLDPASFSADITNPYWPMKPGTRWIYRGVEPGSDPEDIVIVATTATKKLANGVTARVVRDTARETGRSSRTRSTVRAGFAGQCLVHGRANRRVRERQDRQPRRLLGGRRCRGQPGIMLPAQPEVGQKYRQEYKQGEAEDNGEVLATSHLVEVKAGSYKDAVVTMDTSTIEPDVVEYKFYAPNVGPVLALDVSGGAAREGLVKIDKAAPGDGTGPIGKPNPDLSGTCAYGSPVDDRGILHEGSGMWL